MKSIYKYLCVIMKMDTNTEQRRKRLEEKVFGKEEDFVVIDIPGARLRMKKRQERDKGGDRIMSTYKEVIKECRLMTKYELLAMRDHAIKKLGEKWKDVEAVEKLFGVADMRYSEWIYDIDEVAGYRWNVGADAGPFCASLDYAPSVVDCLIGFRCCRDLES